MSREGLIKARKIIKEQKLDIMLFPGAEVMTAEGAIFLARPRIVSPS